MEAKGAGQGAARARARRPREGALAASALPAGTFNRNSEERRPRSRRRQRRQARRRQARAKRVTARSSSRSSTCKRQVLRARRARPHVSVMAVKSSGPGEGNTDDSDEVDVIERRFVIVRHRRQKYRCACGHCETAIGPRRWLSGGRYSAAFAIAVVVGKQTSTIWLLERQVRQMARQGVDCDSNTLFDQQVGRSRTSSGSRMTASPPCNASGSCCTLRTRRGGRCSTASRRRAGTCGTSSRCRRLLCDPRGPRRRARRGVARGLRGIRDERRLRRLRSHSRSALSEAATHRVSRARAPQIRRVRRGVPRGDRAHPRSSIGQLYKVEERRRRLHGSQAWSCATRPRAPSCANSRRC